MKKAKPRKRKKKLTQYHEDVYPARLNALHGGPLSVFAPWLPAVFAFMPIVMLTWISPDNHMVSMDHQSLN